MSPPYGRFVEGDMCLDFDDGWTHVIAWDKHSAYKDGIGKVVHAKAVDFIGIRRDGTLYFIEMKDYRFHRAPDGRKKPMDAWVELELKVRHSVAGLVGAHRHGCHDDACSPIIAALVEHRRREVNLVYWLDEPRHSGILETTEKMRGKARASTDMNRVKNQLKWLKARICSTSSTKDYERVLPGVSARSLPQDLQARAMLVVTMLGACGMKVPQEVQQRLDAWVHDKRGKQKIDECLCRVPFVSDARQIIEQAG